MLTLQLKHIFPLFMLSILVTAGKYKFSIQEVLVSETREGLGDDDLILAIASTGGASNNSNSWTLESVKESDQIRWDNLTQEVEVSDKASNLSIAFGLSNTPNVDEQKVNNFTQNFVSGIASVAASVPGPQAPVALLLNLTLRYFAEDFFALFDCAGPVILANVVYGSGVLNNMTQNQKTCEAKTYVNETAQFKACSTSNYTGTNCLECLDAKEERVDEKKSAAWSVHSDGMLSVASLVVVLLGGAYAVLA